MSAALKYCLIQTFLVPTDDIVDGDSESPEIAPRAQKGGPERSSAPAPSPSKPRASREVLMANFLRLLSDWTKGLSKAEKDKKFQDIFKCSFVDSKSWDEDTIKRACAVVEGLLK